MSFCKGVSKHTLFLVSVSLLLSACAKQQIAGSESIHSEAAKQASQSELNVSDIIQETKSALAQAVEDELDLYSPLHLNNAKDQLEQAEHYLDNPPKENPNAAITSAIAAKSIITKAYENKQLVITNLKDVLSTKKILDELEVQTTHRSDYKESMESLSNLIVEIETGNLKKAVLGQQKVIEEMVQLEIRFLQKKHLQKAKQFLEKAYEVEADDYAPITFINALNKIELADKFIKENNRNRIGVEKAGQEAFLAVQQAYFIAIDAKELSNMIPEEAENHVVSLLMKLNKINQQLADEELLPQSFNTASDRILSKAKLLQSQHANLNRSFEKTEEQLADLKEQLAKKQTKQQPTLDDADWLMPSENLKSEERPFEEESFEMMDDD